MRKSRILACILGTLAAAWLSNGAHGSPGPNELSPEEAGSGWKLLFDGKSTAGWRGFRQAGFPEKGWSVADGALQHRKTNGAFGKDGGDLITEKQYSDFDFRFEWRIGAGGNSGVKYFATEDKFTGAGQSALGFEFQLLDDERHPDAKNGPKRITGALYDIIAPAPHKLQPVGEWNDSRLLSRGGHVEHWVNGAKVVEFDLGSEKLKTLIAESKYRSNPGFGESRKGYLALQDHGEDVSFRSLRIRDFAAAN